MGEKEQSRMQRPNEAWARWPRRREVLGTNDQKKKRKNLAALAEKDGTSEGNEKGTKQRKDEEVENGSIEAVGIAELIEEVPERRRRAVETRGSEGAAQIDQCEGQRPEGTLQQVPLHHPRDSKMWEGGKLMDEE